MPEAEKMRKLVGSCLTVVVTNRCCSRRVESLWGRRWKAGEVSSAKTLREMGVELVTHICDKDERAHCQTLSADTPSYAGGFCRVLPKVEPPMCGGRRM
jgi:hypothetical protein